MDDDGRSESMYFLIAIAATHIGRLDMAWYVWGDLQVHKFLRDDYAELGIAREAK